MSRTEVIIEKEYIEELFQKPITELEIPVRSKNCLQAAGIRTLRELVTKEEEELVKGRGFGAGIGLHINQLKKALARMGLSLGMRLEG